MTQPEDRSILREIVRIIEARRRVPEKVTIQAREYLITYLEDHQNRLEEALRRYDPDRLNMLFGQLASKIKYQFSRVVPGRVSEPAKPAAKAPKAAPVKEPKADPVKAPKAAAKKAPARKPTTKKAAAKRPSAKKVVAKAAKKKPAKAKATAKKTAAKRKPAAKKHK